MIHGLFIITVLYFGFFIFTKTAFATEKFNLGMIGPSPAKIIKRFSPMMKYLNNKGLPAGKVITAKNINQMIRYFKSEKVDFMFESAYGTLKIMDAVHALPILIREKKGVKEYNSVIFVRKNSPVKTLSDLKGKIIAFEDPNSTSSYLLPKNILENSGMKLKQSRKPVPGVLAYYFSKDDKNTIAHIRAEKADAGGIKKAEVQGNPDFRTLTPESVYVPRHIVFVRKGVSSDKLKTILLNMKNDPAASDVLEAIKTPTGFSEFQGNADDIMNKIIRRALGL
ncbi:MAG: phosphate/phosphite/phosphonate ABC transporter substrate-binding protein [Desulfobacterales bacterium]|nr:phosphate/phosphite/phosphonate ABC transporter substrate-binding protein [Desulfobacterales bacterium]